MTFIVFVFSTFFLSGLLTVHLRITRGLIVITRIRTSFGWLVGALRMCFHYSRLWLSIISQIKLFINKHPLFIKVYRSKFILETGLNSNLFAIERKNRYDFAFFFFNIWSNNEAGVNAKLFLKPDSF